MTLLQKKLITVSFGGDFFVKNEKDLMAGYPLELVMKLQVRCDALKEYSKLSDEEKKRAEAAAKNSKSKEETDRIINMIAEGNWK